MWFWTARAADTDDLPSTWPVARSTRIHAPGNGAIAARTSSSRRHQDPYSRSEQPSSSGVSPGWWPATAQTTLPAGPATC